ncbi:hypothetical protein B1813_00780 [Saccharomonospora piscinae]|uniref:HTH cro/C1-type domain-containing protein n=1 Tax=Saccharomonospora piscinae TaxID=687388 RepID=A0A1V9ACM2_SACPI|nr:helix-turn-helix domain-containing protein [Saccharomonospora piscinae]OQO94674.1 hypothetical protein B1813_00780 [Saccharomonospora piscinae]TLW94623.1 helix-turn-helix domain-containing protein [Saccharomonospora piscinae]
MEDKRLGNFLRARRELLQPEDVGLRRVGRRRVPGLRREEVAMLAGVSVGYCIRLEQGRERHPSEQVLAALASALRLDSQEETYFYELAGRVATCRNAEESDQVSSIVRRILLDLNHPALVIGRYHQVLFRNALADELYRGLCYGRDLLRLVFLDPAAREFYPDWETIALRTVASLRANIGANLADPQLIELVTELSTQSQDFRRMWPRHDVRAKVREATRIRHPEVGEIILTCETLTVNSTPDQQIIVHCAEPGSPSQRKLSILAESILRTPEGKDVD